MRRGKLNTISIKLVVLIAFFTLISFVFDQLVIQTENKIRDVDFEYERNFKQMYEKIKKDAEKFTKDQGGTKVIENDEFYKSLEEYYYNFLKFADKQVDIQIDILNILRSLTDKKKNENIDIRQDISNLSGSISKYILIAFILQLIIFIIVQLFEVYTTKKELDEKG